MNVEGHHDAGVRVRVHEEADPVAVCPMSPVACHLLWVGTQNRIRWGHWKGLASDRHDQIKG